MSIDNIGNINRSLFKKYHRDAKKKQVKRTDPGSSRANDGLSISREALSRAKVPGYTASIRNMPEIRDSLVEPAKERIDTGVYLTRETAEATAEKMIDNG